jgi:FkbM family methyltransferase
VRAPSNKPEGAFPLHWWRLKRSLGRRWREWRLPHGFERLGTRYGGWWVFAPAVRKDPLLVDCGLGKDISFPVAFLARFGGRVVGIDPNPDALAYSRANRPQGMEVRDEAFWSEAGRELVFHLPRPAAQLPEGADGVSGSLLGSHSYAGQATLGVRTTSLREVLAREGREECDVLKLDIEGAEYDVLEALCRSGEIRRARQLLVEFHHHCTDRTFQDTLGAIARVCASGFIERHSEDRNAAFLRDDLAPPRAA